METDTFNTLVDYIKSKENDWVYITRDIVSRVTNLPIGSHVFKLIEFLRYHPNIIFKYNHCVSYPRVKMYFKYVTEEEKKHHGLTYDQVIRIPEEDFEYFRKIISISIPSLEKSLKAIRFLDILFKRNLDKQWGKLDIGSFRRVLFLSSVEIYDLISIFTTVGILKQVPKTGEYRICTEETDINQLKKEMAARSSSASVNLQIQSEVRGVDSMPFATLRDLNDISDAIVQVQKAITTISDAMSSAIISMNNLYKTDKNITASATSFVRLSDSYSKVIKENDKLKERLAKMSELADKIDAENTTRTGEQMRAIKEMKRLSEE
jgi:hypothetical protein